MSGAFKKYGVDRNTIVLTAPIAELAIAAPNKYSALLEAHGKDKLAVFANRCKKAVDEDAEISAAVKNMKTERKLLPNKTNN